MSGSSKSMLKSAMQEDFPEPISGYLMEVRFSCLCVLGRIYCDTSGVYSDGEIIVPEEIIKVAQYGRRWMVKTTGIGTLVVVGFDRRGGFISLKQLIGYFQSASLVGAGLSIH